MHTDYARLEQKLRLKYGLDRLLALLMLYLVLPCFLYIPLFILIDGWRNKKNRGPIFYSEPRISAGKTFRILKFRTVPQSIVNWVREAPEDRCITTQTETTWAGRILLKWYLDELPQLINILKGEMSFVGPRPHIRKQYEWDLEQGFAYRKYVKAGLLGVPQVCKRPSKTKQTLEAMAQTDRSEEKSLNTLDGLYTRVCLRRNIWGILGFDLWIIWRGVVAIVRGAW